jgi:hypothetical protein
MTRSFNFTFRYIDDVLSLNNSRFGDFVDRVYPIELEIRDTTDTEECTLCGLLYVGETRQTLRSRMNQHRYDARDPKYRILYNHFNQPGPEGQTIWCSKFFQLNYL